MLGQQGGSESVTLTTVQMPVYNHTMGANDAASTSTSPVNMVSAVSTARDSQYAPASAARHGARRSQRAE